MSPPAASSRFVYSYEAGTVATKEKSEVNFTSLNFLLKALFSIPSSVAALVVKVFNAIAGPLSVRLLAAGGTGSATSGVEKQCCNDKDHNRNDRNELVAVVIVVLRLFRHV